MRRQIVRWEALLPIALLGLASAAQAEGVFQYYVFPVQEITGISRAVLPDSSKSVSADQGNTLKYGAMVDQKYTDIFLDDPAQAELSRYFESLVKKGFPTSVVGANQVQAGNSSGSSYAYSPFSQSQCSPTFHVGYHNAFAMAVGVSRLSAYFNTYDDFTQVLIPITYTIRFVKLNGASVVFSKSETIYTRYDTSTASFYDSARNMAPAVLGKLKAAILDDARLVIDRLVQDAVKSFSPKQTEVSVLARDGKYIVFNRGSEIGFSSGFVADAKNDKGEDLSFVVKYATDGTAVATADMLTPDADQVRAGAKLTFAFSSQGKDDAKPTVLAVQYAATKDTPLDSHHVLANALQSIVSDDIGYKVPFNLVKQDPDFWRLKNQIRSEATCGDIFTAMPGFADNATQKRDDPDFFLKLDYVTSPAFTAVGVGGVTTKTQFINGAALSLVDKSAVVRQASFAIAPYELARSAGKGLSFEQAKEVNLKNAALKAMSSLVTGFNPRQKILKINSLNGANLVLSEVVPVSAFGSMKIVRPLRIGKTGKTLYILLNPEEVKLENAGAATAAFAVKGRGLLASDLVILPADSGANRLLKFCDASKKRLFLPATLTDPSKLDGLMGLAIASGIKGYDLVESDARFLQSASIALTEGFFNSSEFTPAEAGQYCIVPVEVQQVGKNECVNRKCSGSGSLMAGVRVFDQSSKVAESAEGGKFEFSSIDEVEVSKFFGYKSFQHMTNSIPPIKAKLN